MTKFKVGSTYQQRSICDHDCIWYFTVTHRTAKTVILDGDSRFRIKAIDGVETIKPLGTYSMAPTLRASKEVE